MRLLIIGDLHGNKPNIYRKGFDAIMAPGDFCSDAPREHMFNALRENMKSREKNPKKRLRWHDLVGKAEARRMVEKSLSDGREILEGLNSLGVPVYVVPGNWDWTQQKDSDWKFLRKNNYGKIVKGLANIIDVHNKRAIIGDYEIIGHGISSGPEYPQYEEDLERLIPEELEKRKKEYEKESRQVSRLFDSALREIIFLSHNVPFNTPIDKITNRNSPRCGYHYGSLIAREMIDRYQPIVCIGGHMHEHFGKCAIGRTIAVNAGFGSNKNV